MQHNTVTQPFVTSLNAIRKYLPSDEGWTKLLKHLNKTKADDEELNLLTVLESNGLTDTLWCLSSIKGQDKAIRLYAVWCARQVQHLMEGRYCLDALDMAEKFAKGEATERELEDASLAAAYASNAAKAAAYASNAAKAANTTKAAFYASNAAAFAASNAAANTAEYDDVKEKQKQELILVLNGKYS
jgi:hypothetical protein